MSDIVAITPPELLTVEETAELLRVCRNTVYKMIELDELPGVRRFGRAIRVHRATVVAWLSSDNSSGSQSR